jgi:4-hydroxybenzoyl-CoA reductase subunit beta
VMRLPPFRYLAPSTTAEAVSMLGAEGPTASVVAGGTDLYPNMKRRHQTPATLVALRRVKDLAGLAPGDAVPGAEPGGLRIGPATTLTSLERDARFRAAEPALWTAVRSISTPLLRNMGTIGGNVLLDTRCNYYDQSFEWRRAVDFCMKCDGTVCWVAPSSDRCWAVQSSDTAPVLCALNASVRLVSPRGERTIPIDSLYVEDGIRFLSKEPDELLTDVLLPSGRGVRSVYRKVRRRGTFDFPVLGVAIAARLAGDVVESARVFLGAVASAPLRARDVESFLVGKRIAEDTAREAGDLAARHAKPLDNTDLESAWRRKMVRVEVRRGVLDLAPARA